MPGRTAQQTAPGVFASRRTLLRRAALLVFCGAGSRQLAAGAGQPEGQGESEEASIRQSLTASGLGLVQARSGPLYLVVGDAPGAFLDQALALCEALARDFLAHFQARKFAVRRPERRLSVVALAGPESYAALLGAPQGEAVGGHYDPASDRLVLFDNRGRAGAGPLVARANTVALMHEGAHQLTFHTGLLDPAADVPLCIHEGLGTYAETRRPDGRTGIGRPNEPRLLDLLSALRRGEPLLPLSELFTNDGLLTDPATQQQAYAQSWHLVYYLMQQTQRRVEFRSYLESLRPVGGVSVGDRLRVAEAAFGDLAALERAVRTSLGRLLRG